MNKEQYEEFKSDVVKIAKDSLNSSGKVNWSHVIEELSKFYPNENLNKTRLEPIYRRYKDRYSNNFERAKASQNVESPILNRSSENNMEGTISGLKFNPANYDLLEISKLFKIDTKKWECTSFTTKSWNVSMKDNNGYPVQVVNYGISAKFSRIVELVPDKEDLLEIFNLADKLYKENFSDNIVQPLIIKKVSGNTLVIGTFDMHLGKLAWHRETGENYDISIAAKRFLSAVKDIVNKANNVGIDKIIFPIGNDFFQFDDDESKTTKKTQVDSDVRWQKLFIRGVALLRAAIDYCMLFADVDVIWVPGNHDFKTSFYAFETLRGYYNNVDKVNIDENIQTRTYRLVGVNLLGFTHGDKEKQNRLYTLMSNEVPELWGKSKYREWIVGHYHKGMLTEDNGVVIRILGSLTGTDAWHYQKGFVGAVKAAQGLIFNESTIGPSIIFYHSINVNDE